MALSSESNSLIEYNNLQLPEDLQVVMVYTEWNADVVAELKKGVLRILKQFPQVHIYECLVPGCMEITHAIKKIPSTSKPMAVIALGCIIRGETPHFDYVCSSVTQGITLLNANGAYPIIFGVLTVDNNKQAMERLGGKHGHKGEEAAIAALKMISLQFVKIN